MFSKAGTYPPVGLFSVTHIISIIMCFLLIGVLVFFTRKISTNRLFFMFKIFAVVLTILELFKITWSLRNGYTSLVAWLPLYFCSLFIYALWLTCLKNDFLHKTGIAYIALASIFAGSVFIISPTSSFRAYPIFHFQCIYSMLYHSTMVYSGIMLYVTKSVKVNFQLVVKYCMFVLPFMALAAFLNIRFNTNLMFMSNPTGIPLPFLMNIHNYSKALYMALMLIAHMLLGFVTYSIVKLLNIYKDETKIRIKNN